MKLIIDIPEEVCKEIKADYNGSDVLYCGVKFGTPLPKGHGRLIDADELIKDYGNPDIELLVNNMPTIVESDPETKHEE